MAWRIVEQPNGKLARFSDVCDDFTDVDMTHEEALDECIREGMSVMDAVDKVMRGIEAGNARYIECLETIRTIHGREHVVSEDESNRETGYFAAMRRAHPIKLGDTIDGKRVMMTAWTCKPGLGDVPIYRLDGENDARELSK
jgi:hypothetical protein